MINSIEIPFQNIYFIFLNLSILKKNIKVKDLKNQSMTYLH